MDGSVINKSVTLLQDFERYSAKRLVLPVLIIVVVVFLPPLGLMGYWFGRDWQSSEPRGDLLAGGLLVAGWVLGFALLMFYVVLGSLRTRLLEVGVRVWMWRGWREFYWRDVRAAKVTSQKGSVMTLVLNYGGLRRVRICLNDYRRSRSLFEAIRARLPVPVKVHDFQLANLRDN